MTGRARNVVLAARNFVDDDAAILSSPTAFAASLPLANLRNDRLRKLARALSSSLVLDIDFGATVPVTAIAVLHHNLTGSARWRIRFATSRSGAAGDPGGYGFALADTVYDTRSILRSAPVRAVPSASANILDHDFTARTLPAGAVFTRSSAATFADFTGTLRIAAVDQPRFDHDPSTRAARGLLIEESRTNLLQRSDDFSHAVWAKTNITVSADAVLSPDNTLSADTITATLTSHSLDYNPGVSVSAGMHVHSVFARAGSAAHLFLREQGVANTEVVFSLSGAGSIVNASGTVAAGIEAWGNGWYRCWQAYTATVGTAITTFRVCNSAGSVITGSLSVWGAQLEAGAFPTSYIPTTSAAVTRAADVLTLPVSALPWNVAAGTSVLTARMLSVTGGSYGMRYDNGADTNRIMQRLGGSGSMRLTVVSGDVEVADIASTVTAGAVFRHASAWELNNFAAVLNGGTVGTDGSGAVPTGITTLRFSGSVGASFLNGHVSRLTYIPARLSNADLQTLSGLVTTEAQRLTVLAPYAATLVTPSLTLATGARTVIVDQSDMRLYPGVGVRLAIDTANYMEGTATSYDQPSRRLTLDITRVVGAGSGATLTLSRLDSDITVWPDVTPFGRGGYWGQFTWGGLISLVGPDYRPPGIHLPMMATSSDVPVYARYAKIEISDPALTHIDIGRLFLAAAYQPTMNMQYDWSIDQMDPSPRERSRGGQVYADGRPQYRRAELQLAGIGRDEIYSQIYEMRRDLGVRRPFLLILDPTDPVNLHRLTIYGACPDASAPITNPMPGDYYATKIVVEEWL